MQHAQHRSVLTVLGLSTALAFAACQGLDDRKVIRGSEDVNGGDDSGTGNTGNKPSGGGSQNLGGDDTGNPFGGDSSGGVPSVDGPPEVVDVDPPADSDGAEPTGSVSLLFSEALDESTVTADNLQVLDGDSPLEGDVSYDKGVATFTPAGRLALLGTYGVTVSQSVTDTSGQALKEPFSSQFTVRDGAWVAQKSVLDDPLTWGGGQAAMDANGNVLVVYARALDSATPNVRTAMARWINVASGAGVEARLEDAALNCSTVNVGVDADGNALAIWSVNDSTNHVKMRGRRFVDGAWEAAPQDLAGANVNQPMQSAVSTAVAVGGGKVVAGWIRYYYDTTGHYVFESTATELDGAWPNMSTQLQTTTTSGDSLDAVQAVLDPKGYALLTFAFRSSAGTYKGVYYVSKPPGASWQYPEKIPSSTMPSYGVNSGPVLVSDGDGATAVWVDIDASNNYRLKASRYTKAKQFVAPVEIGDKTLTTYTQLRPRGGVATNGKEFWATWVQSFGNTENTYVTRYDIATAKWDELPTLVSDGVSRSLGASTIGVDARGNALVTFDQNAANSTFLVMSARYVASSGTWGEPTPLTAADTYFEEPLLMSAPNGVAGVFYSSQQNETRPRAQNQGGLFRIFK